MQSVSGPTTAVVQVSPKSHGAASAVLQNGQHVLVGKLGVNTTRSVTTASELSTLQTTQSTSGQTIYPAHYIEAITEQTVYAANGENGHFGYLELKSGTPLRKLFASVTRSMSGQYQGYAPIVYAPVSGGQTYYQTSNGQVLASTFGTSATTGAITAHAATIGTGHAQLVTHQGATYLVQSGQLEEDTSTISHTAKASPVTIHWLVENYETAEGVSLPRSTLYFHYLQHCNEHKLEPMNPASFGKLIRSIFFGLRTRRLGTRGNSKYHYYGIRIKPNSPLNHFVEDAGFSLRHYPNYHRQTMEAAAEWKNFANSSVNRVKSSSVAPGSSGLSHSSSQNLHNQQNSTLSSSLQLCGSQHNSEKQFTSYVSNISSQCATSTGDSTAASGTVSSPALVSNAQRQHAQFLGEAISALPNLDEICRSAGLPVPGETDLNSLANDPNMSGKTKGKIGATSYNPSFCADVIKFCRLYALSARYMLDAVVNLEFTAIETEWKNFWRTEDVRDSRLQQSLSQDRLCAIVSDSAVLQFVRLYDHTFYQSLAEVLIPNVLRPIPPALTQAIRNFAKSLEGWMRQATQGLDPTLVGLKVSAVSSLAQTLRRYTSLNHLAQAARAVLKNANQINQMLTDLNRVDFNNVQEQASWVCQCNDATVSQLEQDFKRILHKHATLEEWAQWLDTVVTTILQPLEGNSLAYTRAAHQLILKWSFYSSMVIRDLTLRSAASFGSFHLIRLLYDEYIFYLVEHKVAAHLGMTPVAVMGEMGRDITQQHYAQSRLHSDLTTRRDSKPAAVVPEADDAFDTLNFNEHSGGLRDEDYLSTPNNRLPKSNDDNGAAAQNPEDDEEVDEYLDDEEDVDDSVGEEGAMLKHAHASVQAYCRSSAAVGTGKPPDAPLFTIVKTVGSEESGVIKLASDATGTATGTSQPPIATTVTSDEDNSATAEKKNEALNTDHKDIELDAKSEASPTVAASGASDTSCSPPPIVALPNPVRKVVRVTTFCDSRQSTSSSASSNLSITTTKPSERSPSGTGDVSLATTDSLHDQLPGRTNSSATFALNIDRSVANLSAVNTESTSAKRIRLT